NVRALPDMPGQRAADDLGAKACQQPHVPQTFQPHFLEVVGAGFAFVDAGKDLDLVADLGVGGQILRFDPPAANAAGGFHLGPVVLRLLADVHQPGGFPSDLLAELWSRHAVPRFAGPGPNRPTRWPMMRGARAWVGDTVQMI